MNIRRKLKAHSEIHTGPLNDILFILLLFFLIAATIANPNIVKVNNPRGVKDTKAKQNIVVSIDKGQQIYIGSTPVSSIDIDSALVREINKWKKTVDTPVVTINADTLANWGQVFRLNQLAKSNHTKVAVNVKGM